ncbi:kinase-like protein [Trametes cingulata]|nr:kinase-like protein [Trametes cingulata]
MSATRQTRHDTGEAFAVLTNEERYWRDRQEFLESRGYMLRPRYKPDWVPSWRGKAAYAWFRAEDAKPLPYRTSVIDATRMSDGRIVYLKRVRRDSQELQILSFLSSEELRRDPRNHCVPLLDVLQDPSDPDTSFMVMPFLRYIDSPPFELVEDVLECLDQILEGLVFIHDHGVAHRDCAFKNIMMDASALFPRGFHPIAQSRLPDVSDTAPVLSRTAVPVHYYFIDFGISTRFMSDEPRLVVGTLGLDQEPPELSDDVPYDPFKLDVFLIGNLIRRELHAQRYSNLSMLEPLMRRMTHPNPAQRPTAAEAYREFKELRRGHAEEDEEDVFAMLTTEERYWRDRQEFLESRGYMLRPRYKPDWTPSWTGKSEFAWVYAEDAQPLPWRSSVMDATRISDGTLVYLKRVPSDSLEVEILSYVSSEDMRRDPRNHCVPLLDVIRDDSQPNVSFIVMPFLRYIDSPSFELVDDILECLDQILEGLVFLHDHGVAHRDCAFKNIMMDASRLYPRGFHPIADTRLPDVSARAPVLSRSTVPVKYYFIDFGISTRFASDDEPRLVTGKLGLDREPPELSDDVPYDPFKLDVFLIGNLIRRELHARYSNLTMLEPLMARMVQRDPARRPTAAEAYRQFKEIRRKVPTLYRYWYLQPRDSVLLARGVRAAFSLASFYSRRPSECPANGVRTGVRYVSLDLLILV